MNRHERPAPAQLNIKDQETHRLASELAAREGVSMAAAVKIALREKLEREETVSETARQERIDRVRKIMAPIWASPIVDDRTADEILGYDENGLPT